MANPSEKGDGHVTNAQYHASEVQTMTFQKMKKAVTLYVEHLQSLHRSQNTISTYRASISSLIQWMENNGCKDNQEVTGETITKWRNFLHDKGNSQNTILSRVLTIHTFFAWCIRQKITEENVVSTDDIPPLEHREITLLDSEDIDKLLHVIPSRTHKNISLRTRAIVIFALQTGLRNSEIRELTLDDLDFEHGWVLVKHGKGNKRRKAPFPKFAQECVKDYLNSGIRPSWVKSSDILFGNNKVGSKYDKNAWHAYSSQQINLSVKRYVKNVTGKEIHLHTLRHCATALWDSRGVPIRTIQNALGHNSIRTTENVYLYVLNKNQSAMEINSALENME